jgi:hypothetical protein
MAVDILTRWNRQSFEEWDAQHRGILDLSSGKRGCLREKYHGDACAAHVLCHEAFGAEGEARIPAKTLRRRLNHALKISKARLRLVHELDDKEVERIAQSYRDFVSFCERKEEEQGEPLLFIVNW